MVGLAKALAELGFTVTYVAQEHMSLDRKQQGWLEPEHGCVQLEIAEDEHSVRQLVNKAAIDSIHICQGIRSNGLVGVAQRALRSRSLTQWVVMETVMDAGWRGVLKRLEYGRLFRRWRGNLAGVLATGYRTADWVVQQGMPKCRVFPFAYFLDGSGQITEGEIELSPFRFIFVGQFIARKRLDWLLKSLASIISLEFEVVVVGSGPMEMALRREATELLGDRVRWVGRLQSDQVSHHVKMADCLVLPSLFDGWGAVVSEALIAGTPVICSDTCGTAHLVALSGVGGVFDSRRIDDLKFCLETCIDVGKVDTTKREHLANWATCLTAQAGAQYLSQILCLPDEGDEEVTAPWAPLEWLDPTECE
ncbi:MAG: glycosyltransferase family 4 protein [Hyphomicrobiales bacterium]